MESNKPVLFLIAMAVAVAITGTVVLEVADNPSVPLDDRSLAMIRGADAQYQKTVPVSCESMGVQALNQIPLRLQGNGQTSWVPQSGCGGANIGFSCGSCTVNSSGNMGIPPATYVNGTGQQENPTDCGDVQAGTCGQTNPGQNPPNWGCQGQQVVINQKNNLIYACSDIVPLVPQSGGGGGPSGS